MGHGANRALVTGASSGLGIALAQDLASRGYSLALTARSEAPMQRLADALRGAYGIDVLVEVLDLSEPGSAARLAERLDRRGFEPDVLANNAAFGMNETFVEHDAARLADMLQLNIVSLTELTHLYGRRMAARGSGHILLVSSIAAFQPDPMLAAYGASKAYVSSLGEALNVELGPRVGVSVLCPGLMDTGFAAVAGLEIPGAVRTSMLTPEEVARVGLDALFRGRPSVVAGRMNRLLAALSRVAPRRLAARETFRRLSAMRSSGPPAD